MKIQATTTDAYKLFHEGVQALSNVEANGIRIDTNYLQQAMTDTLDKIRTLTAQLHSDKIYRRWKKRYGTSFNLDSTVQLGKVLFTDMGYDCPTYTKTGQPKTDIATLETLNIPFIKIYLEIKNYKKAYSTYLKGIEREVSDGYIHPVFNLHLVQTFRSSSDSPNFQNMPVRNEIMGALIRRCFIPRRSKNHIVELDYSGIEVHGASWYHLDPVMLNYLRDKSKDMHRDMAQQCYKLPKSEMIPQNKKDAKRIKKIRYCGKNKFVFPEFYGDWFFSCAPLLWDSIDQLGLVTRKGIPLKKYLHRKGITHLGKINYDAPIAPDSFIQHIKNVENHFWNKRFKVYKEWKDQWRSEYNTNGYVTSLTGFRLGGIMKRNEVINYPVQGTAFHCLLWSLIRLQKLLRKYRMKTLIIGQVHDSIVADVPSRELKDYLELANRVMTVDIKKHWKWICTPIEIEADVAPVGKSWFEKQEYKLN